jgi:hypothetical protein
MERKGVVKDLEALAETQQNHPPSPGVFPGQSRPRTEPHVDRHFPRFFGSGGDREQAGFIMIVGDNKPLVSNTINSPPVCAYLSLLP